MLKLFMFYLFFNLWFLYATNFRFTFSPWLECFEIKIWWLILLISLLVIVMPVFLRLQNGEFDMNKP